MMKHRKLLQILGAATVGLALAGCQSAMPSSTATGTHADNSKDVNSPQLAAYREAPLPYTGSEASPTEVIAVSQPSAQTYQWMTVRSPAFGPNEPIPQQFAGPDGSTPPLTWSDPPVGTQSIAIVVEDPDAVSPRPFVHMILYNLPANQRDLPAGAIGENATTAKFGGAVEGTNSAGAMGYFGPTPPQSDPAHHYHFQVFALDTTLNLPQGATKQDLMKAIDGHVLAKGETVGTFAR
ncbi:MAG TPA: YbhB/YbcL family Raf kinase inhibitor-like protein [Tepidisphaeraceae bacterium]